MLRNISRQGLLAVLMLVVSTNISVADTFRDCGSDTLELFELMQATPEELRVYHVGERPAQERLLGRDLETGILSNGLFRIFSRDGNCLWEFEAEHVVRDANILVAKAQNSGFLTPAWLPPEVCLNGENVCPIWQKLGIYEVVANTFSDCLIISECVDEVAAWLDQNLFFLETTQIDDKGDAIQQFVIFGVDSWRNVSDRVYSN